MIEIEQTQRGWEVGGVDRWRRRSARQNPSRWSRPPIPPGERRYRIFKRLYLLAPRELFGDLRDGRGIERWSPVTGKAA
jgi:hypothetical protein